VAEGVRIDGMIGYQLLARFLTTIDYANSKLTLAMPSAAPASVPGAAAIGFYIDGTIPRIPITVDGVATTAEVDTGSRGGLSLSTPFVAAHPEIAALAKTPPGVEGFGVGGPAYARLGRIPTLQIGPYDISNGVAAFGVQTKGAFADPFNPANIGGAIWRRFDVTFDYAHQQLLLAKNAEFDATFSYDRSGLFLIDANGAYTVLSVLPGSPGASAGLAKGDVILGINGAPASNDSLAALRALLSSPAGTVVHLHVRGAQGSVRDVTVTLADYV
jgi:PDZ domain